MTKVDAYATSVFIENDNRISFYFDYEIVKTSHHTKKI